MKTQVLEVHTGANRGVTDLTADATAFVRGEGDGLLNVFVPHATAGVAIIETGAGSDHDLMDVLEEHFFQAVLDLLKV